MIVKSNDNTSFKASVKYDRALVLRTLAKDARIKNQDCSPILDLLSRIDSLSKMKEDSIVEILPFDRKGQATLVCNIYDKNKKIQSVVEPRSALKLLNEPEYREKYFQQALKKVKSVFKAQNQIEKLAENVSKYKNIKGIIEGGVKKESTAQNLKNYLTKTSFSSHLTKAIEDGFNPLKQILNFFKSIDKNSKGQELFFEIGSSRTKNHYTQSFIRVLSNKNEAIIPLNKLFEEPPALKALKMLDK